MGLYDGLLWRYQLHLLPHILLEENLLGTIVRRSRNCAFKRAASPSCYIFADAGNIGDRVSALGVQFLAGKPGVELFASPAGLNTTFGALRWLQENRPKTRIIIGGGGLLQECFEPFWTQLLKTSFNFVLFGIGANEIPGKRRLPSNELLKKISHRASAIHVRDTWTQGLLQHGQKLEVSTGVCPSVNYLVSQFPRDSGKPVRHLLHVRHPTDIGMSGGNSRQITALVRSVSSELNLKYEETDHIKEDLVQLAERYRRARFVISSRLHGCIFSYAFRVPFVPVIADRKTAAFVESHIPGTPTAGVTFTKSEIIQKLLLAEELNNMAGDENIDAAISNNECAMRNAIARQDVM